MSNATQYSQSLLEVAQPCAARVGQIVKIHRFPDGLAEGGEPDAIDDVPMRCGIVPVEEGLAVRLQRQTVPIRIYEDPVSSLEELETLWSAGDEAAEGFARPVTVPLGSIERWASLLSDADLNQALKDREPKPLVGTKYDATGVRSFLAENARGVIDVVRHDLIPHVLRRMVTLRDTPDSQKSGSDKKHHELNRVLVICNDSESAVAISEELRKLGEWVALWAPGKNHRDTKRINAHWELHSNGSVSSSDVADSCPHEKSAEADALFDWSKSVTVVVTSRKSALSLLYDRHVALDVAIFVDGPTATFKSAEKLLRLISPNARLFAFAVNSHRYPPGDIDVLESVFGPAKIMINSLDRRACVPCVQFEEPPRPRKKIERPAKGLSEGERQQFLQAQTSGLKFRNKAGARLAAGFAGTRPLPAHLSSLTTSQHPRVAAVVANSQQLVDVLARLDPHSWRGFTDTPEDVVELDPKLKPFVGDAKKNPPPVAKGLLKLPAKNRFVVVTRSLVAKVGQRDVFIRLDGGRDSLPLARHQLTVNEAGHEIVILDFDDSDLSPELKQNTISRKSAYLSRGFSCSSGPSAKPRKRQSKRLNAIDLHYAGGKESGGRRRHGGREKDIERGRRKAATLRGGIEHMSIGEVGDSDVLLGKLCELQESNRHGQSGGPDGIPPSEIGRQDRLQIARVIESQLLADSYFAGPVTCHKIPKERGGTREIQVQTIPDRIVAGALSDSLVHRVRKQADDVSFSVPGRGAPEMLATLKAVVDTSEHPVIVKLDVRTAFDTVRIKDVMDVLDSAQHVSELYDAPERPLFTKKGTEYFKGTNRHLDAIGLDLEPIRELARGLERSVSPC